MIGPLNYTLRDQARFYGEVLGWSTFPVCRKKPVLRWKHLQKRRPYQTEYDLHYSLLTRKFPEGADGIGVVHGQVSGGVCNRDFDDLRAYEDWSSAFPDLSGRLPTNLTARGCQVWFNCPSAKRLYEFPDDSGEFRAGIKSMSVVPPSLHPSGKVYSWANGLPQSMPTLEDPVAAGLIGPHAFGYVCSLPSPAAPKKHKRAEDVVCVRSAPAVIFNTAIEAVIASCVPRTAGQRNHCIWRLLIGLHQTGEVDWSKDGEGELKAIFGEWYWRCHHVISTQGLEWNWQEFRRVADYWKPPKIGKFDLTETRLRSLAAMPSCADNFPADIQLLVLACYCLQANAGQKPFFLSCRDAAEIMRCGKTRSAECLHALESAGIIRLVAQGSYRGCRRNGVRGTVASQWLYLGDRS